MTICQYLLICLWKLAKGIPPRPPPNWHNDCHNKEYKSILSRKLNSMSIPSASIGMSMADKQECVDNYLNAINGAIHTAVEEAGCVTKNNFKPKSYWCPELSALRDRKRFWWSLWDQNGRPRSGVVFDCYKSITKLRIKSCRRATYGLQSVGMSYPGLNSEAKAHLWRTICCPTLVYGMDTIPMSIYSQKRLDTTQGCTLKHVLGIPKRNHHSQLLEALDIHKVKTIIENRTVALYNRIFKLPSSPTKKYMYL